MLGLCAGLLSVAVRLTAVLPGGGSSRSLQPKCRRTRADVCLVSSLSSLELQGPLASCSLTSHKDAELPSCGAAPLHKTSGCLRLREALPSVRARAQPGAPLKVLRPPALNLGAAWPSKSVCQAPLSVPAAAELVPGRALPVAPSLNYFFLRLGGLHLGPRFRSAKLGWVSRKSTESVADLSYHPTKPVAQPSEGQQVAKLPFRFQHVWLQPGAAEQWLAHASLDPSRQPSSCDVDVRECAGCPCAVGGFEARTPKRPPGRAAKQEVSGPAKLAGDLSVKASKPSKQKWDQMILAELCLPPLSVQKVGHSFSAKRGPGSQRPQSLHRGCCFAFPAASCQRRLCPF